MGKNIYMLRVALIGCGAIGSTIAQAVSRGSAGDARLVLLFDVEADKAKKLAGSIGAKAAHEFSGILRSDAALVVEAASQAAVRDYAARVLAAGKDLMIMSSGALLDARLLARLLRAAKQGNARVYVPSGAICGLDAIKAAAGRISGITLTTTKPPGSFGLMLRKRKVLFEGSAAEAVKRFPFNINVAATLSLAAGRAVRVRIVADPAAKRNTHEIVAKGAFGEILAKTSNVPFPGNERTSYIAALSAIRAIKNITGVMKVGT
jgi:aspartate dehydrogenase